MSIMRSCAVGPLLILSLVLPPGCSQVFSEGEDLAPEVNPVSSTGVCCWQAGDDPREPHLRLDPVQHDCTPAERQIRRRQCDSVCCLTPGGLLLGIMRGLCEARGGRNGRCLKEFAMCCLREGSYQLVPACISPEEQENVLLCDQICCRDPGGTGWMSEGSCLARGTWVDPRLCDQDAATGSL